jgi:DNA topoisomerase III
MGKTLVIAEKPSVALDFARALGRFEKKGDFFENDQFVISSAIGHLVELSLPGEIDKRKGKWSLQNLPIVPEDFQLKLIARAENRYRLLCRLMERQDVDEVVNACDAGREGELIFRYLIKLAGIKKPLRRLWLQSMTSDAIRSGFAHLRSDREMIPLAEAALCRSESDWLVGINATRAFTAFMNLKMGGFQKTPAGRVQTPTLAILVEREEHIRTFEPKTYWEVLADFEVSGGRYQGRWFDEHFEKNNDEARRPERIWTVEQAEAIRNKVLGKSGNITDEKKTTIKAPPLLYDLTSLQREANTRFSFSAQRTLQIAQQLYERCKLITYPRTDSSYLPEDYLGTASNVLRRFPDPSLAPAARKVLENNWVRPSKRIFNNAKITDHNAIIPTGEDPRNLDEAQQKLFDMIACRFIAVFYPPAEYEVTTRITRVEGEAFKTEGKVIREPGWLEVGRHAPTEEQSDALAAVTRGEQALAPQVEVKENQTKPPSRYTDATLLSAMESAGRLVDDEDLREAMSAKGLGTPATRAEIIEGLIKDRYVNRENRELIASAKGISLITLLRQIGIDLSSPELTGEWEYKLKQMEQGELDRPAFMTQIKQLAREIVDKVKHFESHVVGADDVTLKAHCPNCGAAKLKEDYRMYRCENCRYRLFKNLAGRELSPEEVTKLIQERKVGPLEGFRRKTGGAFSALVVLNEKNRLRFAFESSTLPASVQVDRETHQPMGPCQVCHPGQVFDVASAYVCENVSKGSCSFKMSKMIRQREIAPEQMQKLLKEGKSDLLRGFISKKGKRFDAVLTLTNGKLGWEFANRETRVRKKKPEP